MRFYNKKFKLLAFICVIGILFLSLPLTSSASVLRDYISPSEEELELMQSQEVYTVGYIENYSPISYSVDGELIGISIDILNEFADVLGIQLEYVDLDDPDINEEDVDINIHAANFTTQRKSEPLSTYATMICTLADFDGELETVSARYDFGLAEIDPELENSEMVYYNTVQEAIDAMASGETDAVLMSTIGYEQVANQVTDGSYVLRTLETPLDICFIYSDTFDQEKIDIIDSLIVQLDSNELRLLRQVHSNYIERTYTLFEEALAHLNLVGTVFFLTFFIMMAVIFEHSLYKRKRLEWEKDHDSLTSLLSLSKFKSEAARRIQLYPNRNYHILATDMDNFKYINEHYGYETGTQVIQLSGEVIQQIPGLVNGMVARTFGDNFLLLLQGDAIHTSLNGYEDSYVNLKRKITALLGDNFNLSISLGLYTVDRSRDFDINVMIDYAYVARDLGKKVSGYTLFHYTEEMHALRRAHNHITSSMQKAIDNEEFVIYYQVKEDLQTQMPVGAEALVRWQHQDRLIPPNEFIPIFESNGFITTLDYYVIHKVCQFIIANPLCNLQNISVNLSGYTFMQGDVAQRIIEIVDSYNLCHSLIDLEITESAVINQTEHSINQLNHLRKQGFTISMDDFGSGISSLNQLSTVPLDALKLDRGFIAKGFESERGKTILRNVIHMANELQLKTIAEGIETYKHLEYLRDQGCDIGQGYYLSRPLPEKDFLRFMENSN